MIIKLRPHLTDKPIQAFVNGEVITINGEPIDLSSVPDGFRLPGAAVGNEWFVETEYVERVNGELSVTLRLPVDWESPEEYRNPSAPIVLNVPGGNVEFPDTTPPAPIADDPQPDPDVREEAPND